MLPHWVSAKVFIPGKSCGVSNPVRVMDDVPEDFDGDTTGLACTMLKDGKNWNKYYSSLPGMAFTLLIVFCLSNVENSPT